MFQFAFDLAQNASHGGRRFVRQICTGFDVQGCEGDLPP
jgi:hypothetical protein